MDIKKNDSKIEIVEKNDSKKDLIKIEKALKDTLLETVSDSNQKQYQGLKVFVSVFDLINTFKDTTTQNRIITFCKKKNSILDWIELEKDTNLIELAKQGKITTKVIKDKIFYNIKK